MQRARVIAAHRSPEHSPIRVSTGDAVTLGERDKDWPQFVWASLAQGLGGWIPAILFDRDIGEATALGDYDTRELNTEIGEIVMVHHEQESWCWVENAAGESGWVPLRALETIDPAL